MQLVIADTGPVNYLILIGHIDLIPRLFQRVILPEAVKDELDDSNAPAAVRAWIGSPPAWLEIMETPGRTCRAIRTRRLRGGGRATAPNNLPKSGGSA